MHITCEPLDLISPEVFGCLLLCKRSSMLSNLASSLTCLEAVTPSWPAVCRYTSCSKTWVQSVGYLEIVGIIIGQIGVGIIGDWVGRRYGLIQDAAVMLLGSAMLTASWGLSLQGWVVMYTFSLFIFGVGVGGGHDKIK